MSKKNTFSALDRLKDLSIVPGSVFIGPWEGIDHEKFLIVAGVNPERILVCSGQDGGTGSVSPVALTLRYARTIKGPAYFFYRLARNKELIIYAIEYTLRGMGWKTPEKKNGKIVASFKRIV